MDVDAWKKKCKIQNTYIVSSKKNDDWDIRIFIFVTKDKECCAKIVAVHSEIPKNA